MTDIEIIEFIECMEEIGDCEWIPESVKDTYGDKTLEDALAERRSIMNMWGDICHTLLNR